MDGKLYSAARIGEFAGVSRQFVTRYCNNHCPEAKTGRKIDISHPVMAEWLKGKGINITGELKSAPERTSHLAKNPVSQSESVLSAGGSPRQARNKDDIGAVKSPATTDISQHGQLTINEIAAYYGDHEQYRGWLDAKKKQVEIIERELKVKERLGELVSRDVVKKGTLDLISGLTSGLLTDHCKSAPIDLRAAFESGKDDIEIEKILRKLISKQLQSTVKKVTENLGD